VAASLKTGISTARHGIGKLVGIMEKSLNPRPLASLEEKAG